MSKYTIYLTENEAKPPVALTEDSIVTCMLTASILKALLRVVNKIEMQSDWRTF